MTLGGLMPARLKMLTRFPTKLWVEMCFFFIMDLTSGDYNVLLREDYKKHTALSSPLGLDEYNQASRSLT